MRLIFYLCGDNPELSGGEVVFLLKEGLLKSFRLINQFLIADVEDEKKVLELAKRLSFTHEVCKLLGECRDLEEAERLLEKLEVEEGTRACVRVEKVGEVSVNRKSPELERRFGKVLKSKGCTIDLSSPETMVKVYVSSQGIFAGELLESFRARETMERGKKPFSTSFALPPRLAKALVNLASAKQNLLDPMCGTGTILVEASLMGVKACGVEAFEKVIRGCKKNLEYFGVSCSIVKGDVCELPFRDESFEAVATNFPYLKSAKKYGGKTFFREALEEICRVLQKGKRCSMVLSFDAEELLEEFFVVERKFEQRVHKSLSRRIYVCRKKA